MRAKIVNAPNDLPSFDDIYEDAPDLIKDYVDRCNETPQGAKYHPEGNVYTHIRLVFDRTSQTGDIDLMFAAFFHDLGKVDTTKRYERDGEVGYSAHGHEKVSKRLAERYADWIESYGADSSRVIDIVDNHMRMHQYDNMRPSKQERFKAGVNFSKISKFGDFDDMSTLSDDEMHRY